jgi:hypothetical protein
LYELDEARGEADWDSAAGKQEAQAQALRHLTERFMYLLTYPDG